MKRTPTVIDLFCGAGGLSEGFRQAGFNVLVGNDFDRAAGNTFASTHEKAVFIPGPIEKLTATDFLNAANASPGQIDCLVGGPPCQGFSVNNHNRGMQDVRSHLFRDYLRIVEGLRPKWVVLENVTGILSAGGGTAVRQIYAGLKEQGYQNVDHKVLRSEDYGVPQERRRVVFIANRVGKPIVWPKISYGNSIRPFTTVRDAIGDLPKLKNGERYDSGGYLSRARGDFQKEMRNGSLKVLNHFAPKLGEINIERMAHIPPGGSWRDIPFELLPAGMKRARRSDHTKRYGRMTWDGLASTILTKCDVHWGAYIHPEQDRSITVREAARLQSFPDWFEFKGSRTEQYVQVGNAVPPILGRSIAKAILQVMNTSVDETVLEAAE